MNHGSLFSGIGGFDLAAEWAGFTNLFNCEWEEFPRKVLKHHFPNAEQFEDIKDFNATAYSGRLDILSGGFPCQPFSVAGKRKGSEDERHLWPEMLRVVGVSNNPNSVPSVGRIACGTSWNNKRLDGVPKSFQVSAHLLEYQSVRPTNKPANVLAHDPTG